MVKGWPVSVVISAQEALAVSTLFSRRQSGAIGVGLEKARVASRPSDNLQERLAAKRVLSDPRPVLWVWVTSIRTQRQLKPSSTHSKHN
mmetsp:Transcript_42600/g.112421  ORF Transcript_42600/g.112421 Transcript_42600/m.112421 type:complete len:89 (-) Transcript_42600:8-274(-)